MHFFQRHHIEGLLNRLDIATMNASVEGRVPFLDHELIDFINTLPLKYKLGNTSKYILKKVAEKYLPKEIIYREKIGFPIPLDNLFTKEMLISFLNESNILIKTIISEKELEEMINDSPWKRWMIYNIEYWLRNLNEKK